MTDYDWFEAYRKEKAETERLRAARDRLHERNAALSNEIDRLRSAFDEQNFGRLAIIEECARVADRYSTSVVNGYNTAIAIATAIRALKDKP